MVKSFAIIIALMISKGISAEDASSTSNVDNPNYKTLKNDHAKLHEETKQLDRLIEKTEAIECLDWFDQMISNVLDAFGVSGWIKEFFIGTQLGCQGEKDEALEKLNAKKDLNEERIQKIHNTMKELHPQKKSQEALEKKLKMKLQDTAEMKKKMETQEHLEKKELTE